MNNQGTPPPTPSDQSPVIPVQSGNAAAAVATPMVFATTLSPQRKRIVLVGLGLALVLVVSLLGIALVINDAPATPLMVAGTPMVRITATVLPFAAAPYGSTPDRFTTAYGKPELTSLEVATYTITIQQVKLRLAVTFVKGKDGQLHTATLKLTPTATQWSGPTAGASIATFLPSDAVYLTDKQQNGITYHLFHSDLLAQILPTSQFATIARTPSNVGNFVAFCEADLRYCVLDTKVPG